ncbi:hypothetical protein ABB30_05805 [Stenotrophomonas ginsengisoli]|uniref:DUF4124 domain-containing protein n=1 Tax=Stenotrophomonas ginsengisoli TaxID=336566 RepID=A0A0R0DJV0_9GAMM|nr:hypothetical protein [Stenotrophomonas ginsengisoli]KRG77923.1 hypothetical protein ABB30_05805 [Stenotrophomonas ginsengisoli]
MSAIRLLSLIPVLATGLLAGPALAQQAPPAKKLYCWDQGGQRVCSDTLPPEAVNAARDEFNARSGLRSRQVDRAMSSDERTEAALAKVQADNEQAAEQSRRRTEQALLSSFNSEAELRRVFDERIAMADNNINTARYNIANLRRALVSQLSQAGDRELNGQNVADKPAADIMERRRELATQLRLLSAFEQQRSELDGEIEQTLQRYRSLKGLVAAHNG